jgi:outer membrane protein W
MKKILLIAGAALFSLTIQAQRFDIGANLMLGMPMGNYDFGDNIDQTGIPPGLGLGGGIEANYWFNDAFSAGLEVGFISFGENEINDEELRLNSKGQAIPIIVKGEYHFLEDAIRPFIGLGVGYGIVSREINIPDFLDAKISWNQNGLIVSPRAGLLFQVSDIIALNLNVQYNIMANSVDGDLETTVEMLGDSMTETNTDMKVDATNYLGINIGVLFTLFD